MVDIPRTINSQVELSFVFPQNFFMVVERLPKVQFTIQRAQLPTVTAEEVLLSNSTNPNKTFIPGEGLDYSPLSVDFIIDKHFLNYKSILRWIKGVGSPEDHDQFTNFVNDTKDLYGTNFQKLMSNISIVGTDAGLTPVAEWQFFDCFPTDCDGPQFDATLTDVEYFQAACTFRYKYFIFKSFTDGVDDNDHI